MLDAYLPRGGFAAGHILVTTRQALSGMPADRRISLDCFDAGEPWLMSLSIVVVLKTVRIP